ncbi:hypothetical protein Vretimale_8272 [Volvox reticuliferus]|uniref:RING-type domain-containing protein n=1 Tax=Volvox reticuliferus TaxID=1737510 RepID=A0A8J4CJ43_9CHLO|nr:hypothetical protein Vretifemale_11594 [Volvox reticuliferus]GIM03509.1 hypothetical protein Vretimale_8272 [Volvox reticuliferus]
MQIMDSDPPQGRPGVNASDVTWERLLYILHRRSQAAELSLLGNPSPGAQEEATLGYRVTPSLTDSSPSRSESPEERGDLGMHSSTSMPSLSTPQQQHIHHHGTYQLNTQQQQRPSQPNSHVVTPGISQPRNLLLLGQLSRRAAAAAATARANMVDGLDPDAASVSASAARHRLISETTGISAQMFVDWIADLVPFLLLLAWVFVFEHAGALLLNMFLWASTVTVNGDIRRIIAMRRDARVSVCVAQALTVAVFTSAAVLSTLPDTRLLRVLTLRATEVASAMDTLLLVILADSVLRFGSLAPKLMVIAWFRSKIPSSLGIISGGTTGSDDGGHLTGAKRQRQQSRVLTAVERAVILYRTVLPGPVWYGYLLRGGGFSPVFASLFCGFYLVLKASYVVAQTRLFALALKTATRRGPLYGAYVGRPSGGEEGTFGACPVCQDPVNTPVRLNCGHIFCEECILEWLERDRTCPMCRAEVRPAGLPSCSDGTSPLLPQVF